MTTSAPVRRCPCGSNKPIKPGNEYCGSGCAYRKAFTGGTTSGKKKPTPIPRPAVGRGIPVPIVDALIHVLGIEEGLITRHAMLGMDLGADSLDLCEISMKLEEHYGVEIEDADGWEEEHATVDRVMKDLKQAGAKV